MIGSIRQRGLNSWQIRVYAAPTLKRVNDAS